MTWFSARHHEGVCYVSIHGDVGVLGQTAQDFIDAIGEAEAVDLGINSNGGDTFAAPQIHDAIKGRKVRATITGRCFSSAATLAMAAEHVTMLADARMMIHGPANFCYGDSEFLRCQARALDKILARVGSIIMERTEQPLAIVNQWLSTDTYFTAEQALAAGLIDQIVEPPPLPKMRPAVTAIAVASHTEEEAMFRSFLAAMGRVNVRDRKSFIEDLRMWALWNVRENQLEQLK